MRHGILSQTNRPMLGEAKFSNTGKKVYKKLKETSVSATMSLPSPKAWRSQVF
jgi:hypothetical protein